MAVELVGGVPNQAIPFLFFDNQSALSQIRKKIDCYIFKN
jgi:hypothetical protein